ncbi:MAG: sporulation protein YqfC [Thermoanaerobacteraceae bacterium]|nr:sporulation protein YqfC [Thermoanaerobacteraceae bacterium]
MDKSDFFKRLIEEITDFPRDVVLNLPHIVMIGNLEIDLENFNSLLEYTPDKIRVGTNLGIVMFAGSDLEIKMISQNEIIVTGRIKSIELGLNRR